MPINISNIKPFACRVTRINGTRNKLITSNLARKGFNILGTTVVLMLFFICFAPINKSSAESVRFAVDATGDRLEVTVPSTPVQLVLTPSSDGSFGSADVVVSASTTNITGYYLTMSANTTSLTGNTVINGSRYTIDTLAGDNNGSGYTASEFASSSTNEYTMNKWGYKWNYAGGASEVAADGDWHQDNYYPIATNVGLTKTKANGNPKATTVNFGVKLNNDVPADSYEIELDFIAVTNEIPDSSFEHVFYKVVGPTNKLNGYYKMQDMTPSICSRVPSPANGVVQTTTLIDARDQKTYTVAKLGDDCWMTQNLSFEGTSLSPSTSNVTTSRSISNPQDSKGNSQCYNANGYNYACNHKANLEDMAASGDIYGLSEIGTWYNYMYATAGTISTDNNSVDATEDICPSNWKMPSITEAQSMLSYASAFSPIKAGFYAPGNALFYASSASRWWTSTTSTSSPAIKRIDINYDNYLWTSGAARYSGEFIRCIAKNQ